jgi:hypothetical protein
MAITTTVFKTVAIAQSNCLLEFRLPGTTPDIGIPSSAYDQMTAGGKETCVILPRLSQNGAGNNCHSNKCP